MKLIDTHTRAGSDVARAMEICSWDVFENKVNIHEFIVTIPRESNQVKLTKKQIDILNFCSVPRSSQEIMDRLEITNQTKNRAHYIQSLLELGVLKMTEPDSPNSPTQKYRKKQ